MGFSERVERLKAKRDVGALIRILKYGGLRLKLERDLRRSEAARALAELRSAAAVEPLIRTLASERFFVRASAARALGEIGDRRALAPLLAMVEDGGHSVRTEVGLALARLGDSRGFELLVLLLGRWGDPERICAAVALGELGDPRAVAHLMRVLGTSDEFMGSMAERVLIERGWKTREEIEQAKRGEPCIHDVRFANELCHDCGAPLGQCTSCDAWFHMYPSGNSPTCL
ncbi:MAG: HEAT repeat domain-containing protein [Sphingosinicella sp.]|uniref:HEAT repeat domain-containing protein n=1 Tax=Sphingosinicella sp. TaxID=1917971 RepID=UPI004037B2E7